MNNPFFSRPRRPALLLIFLFLFSHAGQAIDRSATSAAHALAEVSPSASSFSETDLKFEDVKAGAARQVTPPSAPNAAVVKIGAESGKIITLAFPAQLRLLRPGEFLPNAPAIYITDFTSSMARPEVPTRDDGALDTRIGATREKVSLGHPPGYYSGILVTTVVYP